MIHLVYGLRLRLDGVETMSHQLLASTTAASCHAQVLLREADLASGLLGRAVVARVFLKGEADMNEYLKCNLYTY